MNARRIYLASPREPCGATWLINCFLELGIKTWRYSPRGMWKREGAGWSLSPHEEILRKWLPVLDDRSAFEFREDVEVQWTHEWRQPRHDREQVLFFVRDPRDALYSRYKREAPEFSFREYVDFPDPATLLNRIDHLRLYCDVWRGHPNLTVVRFEDYKRDAHGTLAGVLSAIGLDTTVEERERAIRSSTFERAAAAEQAYRQRHPEDVQVINRAGRTQEWQTGEVAGEVVDRVEAGCAHLLAAWGYPCRHAHPEALRLTEHVRMLRFFGSVAIPQHYLGDMAGRDPSAELIAFMRHLTPDLLGRARLPGSDEARLRASLAEYCGRLARSVDAAFAVLPGQTASSAGYLRQLVGRVGGHLRSLVGSHSDN